MTSNKKQVAVHEAGHVVLAWALGWPVCYARIGIDVETDTSEVQICRRVHQDEYPEDTQIYFAAGSAAECIVFGDYRRPAAAEDRTEVLLQEKCKHDFDTNENDSVAEDKEYRAKLFDTYVEQAIQRLRAKEDNIRAVADALEHYGFLSRDQIDKMMERP